MNYFIRLVLLIMLSVPSYAHSNTASPEVSVKAIDIESISFTGIRLQVGFQVTNSTKNDVQVESIDYQLKVNDSQPISGRVQQREYFAAGSSRLVTVPVTVNYDQNTAYILSSLQNPGPTRYDVKGTLYIQGQEPFVFDHQGSARLPVAN